MRCGQAPGGAGKRGAGGRMRGREGQVRQANQGKSLCMLLLMDPLTTSACCLYLLPSSCPPPCMALSHCMSRLYGPCCPTRSLPRSLPSCHSGRCSAMTSPSTRLRYCTSCAPAPWPTRALPPLPPPVTQDAAPPRQAPPQDCTGRTPAPRASLPEGPLGHCG